MSRRKRDDFPSPYVSADATVLAGVCVEVSRETRRARTRSGERLNTNANRRNGGRAATYRPDVEALVGAAIITSPTSAGVRTRDDNGTSLPVEHMTTRITPDERLRTEVAERTGLYNLGAILPRRIETNGMYPSKFDFRGM